MRRPETSSEVLDKCIAEGFLRKQQEYDLNLIKSIVNIAKEDLIQLRKLIAGTKQNDEGWSSIYKMAYDVMHELVDAFLRFDSVKSDNHICLFAHVCERHPELELGWDFFERIRTRRNGVHYYGSQIKYRDWKEIEIQFSVYVSTLLKAIEAKMES